MDDLVDATVDGKIKWWEGSRDTFCCEHKDYVLYLNESRGKDAPRKHVDFRITRGRKDVRFSVYDDEPDAGTMKDLYDNVRVAAVGYQDLVADFFN